jgi:hypothetical protein
MSMIEWHVSCTRSERGNPETLAVFKIRNMNGFRWKCPRFALAISALAAACLTLLAPGLSQAAQEETFPLLQIGTITYTNVTVTTKARKYVFVLHSTGMANIRVADLPPDVKRALGYDDLEKKEEQKKAVVSTWAKQTLARLETPKVLAMERDFQIRLQGHTPEQIKAMIPARRNGIIMALGALLLIYLVSSYCWMLICKKSGNEPGFVIWLPLLQVFPILRTARMSPLWFIIMLIPVINFVPLVLLCFRVAKERHKTPFVGFFLAFPATSLFVFFYLAFSGGAAQSEAAPRSSTGPMRLGAT